MLADMDALSSLHPAQLAAVIAVEIAVIAWGTRSITRSIIALAPWRPLSYPLLLPGTVLHELAHAAAALALGLGVEEIVLFRPTPRPDGSVTLGWVRPRRSSRVRGAIMAAAPILLVPPVLLAVALLAAALPGTQRGASIGLWVLVGLGSLGAFPSRGDRFSVRGALTVLGAGVLAGLAILAVGGGHALSAVLAGAALVLAIPAIVFAALLVPGMILAGGHR